MSKLERGFYVYHKISRENGYITDMSVIISSDNSPQTVEVREDNDKGINVEYYGSLCGKDRFLSQAMQQGVIELVKMNEITVPSIPNIIFKRG